MFQITKQWQTADNFARLLRRHHARGQHCIAVGTGFVFEELQVALHHEVHRSIEMKLLGIDCCQEDDTVFNFIEQESW